MKNFIFLILFCIPLLSIAQEQEQRQLLIVSMKNGKQITFDLEEEPQIMFLGDGNITIYTDMVSTQLIRDHIRNITYNLGLTNSVDELINDKLIELRQQGNNIQIKGLTPNEVVLLYNLSGLKVNSLTSNSLGMLEISMSDYPSGIYVIKVNDQTLKFKKQ